MDDINLKILEMLRQDSRTKFVKIAEFVGLTEGAVRKRVKKMLNEGTIMKFTIETKAEVEGIVLVKTKPALTNETAQKIKVFR